MDTKEFKDQSEQFMMLANYLLANARGSFTAAIEIISKRPALPEVEPQQMCEMQIRKVGSLLGDLCVIYNRLCASIDMPPFFPE